MTDRSVPRSTKMIGTRNYFYDFIHGHQGSARSSDTTKPFLIRLIKSYGIRSTRFFIKIIDRRTILRDGSISIRTWIRMSDISFIRDPSRRMSRARNYRRLPTISNREPLHSNRSPNRHCYHSYLRQPYRCSRISRKGQIVDLLSDMDPALIDLVVQQLGTRQLVVPVFQYIRDQQIRDASRISILVKMIQMLKSPPTKTDPLWDSILTSNPDIQKVDAFLSSCTQRQLAPEIIRNLLQSVCLPTSFRYTSVADIDGILRVFPNGHSEDTYYSCQYHVQQKENDTRRIDLFMTLFRRPPIMIHFQICTHYLASSTSITKSFVFVLQEAANGCTVRLIPTHSQSRLPVGSRPARHRGCVYPPPDTIL